MNYFKSHLSAFFFFAVASVLLVSCEDDSKLPPTNYCGDNIMNYGETGIDCGGPCWPCDATCTDGIQNGSETGVDCGGICTPCPVTSSCTDGVQNGDEEGIDCGGSCPDVCPDATCTDGIQNGDEEGVDCGGADCPACPDATCTDGIQNGDEEGVDCGGSDCPACPTVTCMDGIQNGDEEGVDCGGSDCPACPTATCTDGIQNGDEEGVDCGGSCPNACTPAGEYITAAINGNAFAANLVLGSIDTGTSTISFQSDNSQDDQMFFEVPSTITVGTYDLLSSGFSSELQNISDGPYTTESGSITITAHDTASTPPTLTGTFEFTATIYDIDGNLVNTAVVTSGAFNVEYF